MGMGGAGRMNLFSRNGKRAGSAREMKGKKTKRSSRGREMSPLGKVKERKKRGANRGERKGPA